METNNINELIKIIIDQSPQVAKEYLAMKLWENEVGIIILLILMAVCVVCGIGAYRKKDKSNSFLCGFILVLLLMFFGVANFESYKIRTYPKAYLFEKLVKERK
jgi:hypothetical protein